MTSLLDTSKAGRERPPACPPSPMTLAFAGRGRIADAAFARCLKTVCRSKFPMPESPGQTATITRGRRTRCDRLRVGFAHRDSEPRDRFVLFAAKNATHRADKDESRIPGRLAQIGFAVPEAPGLCLL